MIQIPPINSNEPVIEAMVQLGGPSKSNRIVVTGLNGRELIAQLHRRGYVHAGTPGNLGLPRGQCQAAFLDWRLQSVKSLETLLCWLVHFLGPGAALVIWLDRTGGQRTVKLVLARFGFEIEAASRSEHGLVLAARRGDASAINIAA